MTDNGLRAALVELLDDYLAEHGPDGYPQPMPSAWRTVQSWLTDRATPSLDDAWRKAEEALPEGWVILQLENRVPDIMPDGSTRSRWHAEAQRRIGPVVEWNRHRTVLASGPTPAAALNALAERLAQEAPDGD